MRKNRNKSVSVWTHKHEEFCLQNQIPRFAQLLWEWLIKKGEVDKETEPDLKDFNNWIGKHRGRKYCRNTLKSAFNKLVECRVVNLVKRYTWHIVKIVTRPIEYLKPKRKLQKQNIFDNLDSSKGKFYNDVSLQQQQKLIINNKLLFSQYGINFNQDELEVLKRPKNEVLLAITCYQIRDRGVVTCLNQRRITRGKIKNPEGWIRNCLRKRLWDEPRMYSEIIAEYGNTTFLEELFPKENQEYT